MKDFFPLDRKRIYLLTAAVAVMFLLLFRVPLLSSFAYFLIVEDEPRAADVIVVLGGGDDGKREEHGAKLYRQGLARTIVVTGGPVGWRMTHAQIMQKHLIVLGVPTKNIFLVDTSENTYEDALYTLEILQPKKCRSLLLVTSPFHSRRASKVFRRMYRSEGIEVISCPVPVEDSWFNPQYWWRSRKTAKTVFYEYQKLLWYFLRRQL